MINPKIGSSLVSKVVRPPVRKEVPAVAARNTGVARPAQPGVADRFDRASGASAELRRTASKVSSFDPAAIEAAEKVPLSPALEPYRKDLLEIAKKLAPKKHLDTPEKLASAALKQLQKSPVPPNLQPEAADGVKDMSMALKAAPGPVITGEDEGQFFKAPARAIHDAAMKGTEAKEFIEKWLDENNILDKHERESATREIRKELRNLKQESGGRIGEGGSGDIGPGEGGLSPGRKLEDLSGKLEALPKKLEKHRAELEAITQKLARDPSLDTEAKLRKALWSELKRAPLDESLKQGARQVLFDTLTRQRDRFTAQPVNEP